LPDEEHEMVDYRDDDDGCYCTTREVKRLRGRDASEHSKAAGVFV
jgi:hypothetical protein